MIENKAYSLGYIEFSRDEREIVEQELKQAGYREVKTSYSLGYVSRRTGGTLTRYKGRYGVGFAIHTPAFNSTKYHYIAYWIK